MGSTATSRLAATVREWMARQTISVVLSMSITIKPVPAARPRVSRFGTYYPKNYANWRKAAQKLADDWSGEYINGPVFLFIEVVSEKPRTSKLVAPLGDVDNYAKGAMDILTKTEKVWKDDKQVVGLAVFKRWAEAGEKPGTYLLWVPVEV